MGRVDFARLVSEITGQTVERPNKAGAGTLSGHAAGEPFEKLVCSKYRAQNETYMCRSAENVVRCLCFNKLCTAG